MTPPMGMNVFVLRAVLPDVSTGTIFRGGTPFWVAGTARALLVLLQGACCLCRRYSIY